MSRLAPIAIAFTMLITPMGSSSHADEQMRTLASGGDWIALALSESMIGHPGLCAAMNVVSQVAFRADNDGIEFRASNAEWFLPVDVADSVQLVIGDWKSSLEINANSESTVVAGIDADKAGPMFPAMGKAGKMSVTIGKAKLFQVSLNGSPRVINAFLTCAGIGEASKAPGSNPFE